MKHLALSLCAAVFLTGCSTVAERQDHAKDLFNGLSLSASGGISSVFTMWSQIMNAGEHMGDSIEKMVEDTQERVQKVQSGAQMLIEGKRLIEEGIER